LVAAAPCRKIIAPVGDARAPATLAGDRPLARSDRSCAKR
jgi:hypothetical protein